MHSQHLFEVWLQYYVVLLGIFEKFRRSENLCNLDQLIVVVFSPEEGLLVEDLSKTNIRVCRKSLKQPCQKKVTIAASMHPMLHKSSE